MLLVLGGAFGSMFLGLRNAAGGLLPPLTALQVLWINFLGDGPPALALAADRSPSVMQRAPRRGTHRLLDGRTLAFILADGGFKGAVGLALLVLLPRLGASLPATAAGVFLYEAVAKLAREGRDCAYIRQSACQAARACKTAGFCRFAVKIRPRANSR